MTNHTIAQPILPQTEHLTVILDIDLSIALEECARANGVSKAEIVRDALRREVWGD